MLAVRPVVVVSPFVAVGDVADEKTFARGLFENVITALNRFSRISVVSSSAPHLFDGATDGVERTKGVDRAARYVVQGAVYRDGERLRVTARLVGSAGLLLWADRFDGVLADGFDLQDRIAATIAGSVEPTVQAAEARRYNAAGTRNATAHELHLRAQPIFSMGVDNILQSLRLLERAIALDPSHAPSLADAAYCLQLLDINGWAKDRQQTRRRALEYARMALQVSGDAEPVAAAALVFAYFGEEMDAALALGNQAATLNPYLARGLFSNGTARLYAGKLEEAAECFETSARLNPWGHAGRRSVAGLGILHLFEGRLDDAISRLRQAVQEYPRWATVYCTLASCYAHLGHAREAAAVARRLRAVDRSLSPTVDQFRDGRHRELLGPGLRLMRA
jgi:adenylate cyclase